MNKYNACIGIISSRTKCLKKCLASLYQYYNCKYNYPVYIFYFDDIYGSDEYKNDIHTKISSNIHFISIPYESPEHVKEAEMFYNRTKLSYVSRGEFTIQRKGYLHMCNFWINFYGYPNTPFKQYDYLMVHDDEAGYLKEMPEDPFDIITAKSIDMAAFITGQRLRDGKPHQGHYDTRIGLWDFTKNFIIDNHIEPKYALLKKLLNDSCAEDNFHYLPWSDTYVFNLKFAKTELWQKWVKVINESGGVYKYRWGDNEVFSLFAMMYQDQSIYNLGYVHNGYHNQGMFRGIQGFAPSIKDVNR